MNIVYHDFAKQELAETVVYYDEQAPHVSQHFLDDLQQLLLQLTLHPQSGSIVAGPIRRKPMRRFPYTVLYTVLEADLYVLAIMHQHREPTYWIDRL